MLDMEEELELVRLRNRCNGWLMIMGSTGVAGMELVHSKYFKSMEECWLLPQIESAGQRAIFIYPTRTPSFTCLLKFLNRLKTR